MESLILATLSDPELAPHIDRSRISILGWSSGGNLAREFRFYPLVKYTQRLTFNSDGHPAPCNPSHRDLGRGSVPTH